MFIRQIYGYQEVLESYRDPRTGRSTNHYVARWSSGRTLEAEIAVLEALQAFQWQSFRELLKGKSREELAAVIDSWPFTLKELFRYGKSPVRLPKQLARLYAARDGLRESAEFRRLRAFKPPLAWVGIPDPQPKTPIAETFHVRMDGDRPVRLTVAEMSPEDMTLALAFQERELALMADIAAPTLARLQQASLGQDGMSQAELREAHEVAATLTRVQQQTDRLRAALSRAAG